MMGSVLSSSSAAPDQGHGRGVQRTVQDPINLDSSWTGDFMETAYFRTTSEGVNGLFQQIGPAERESVIPEEMMELILSYCSVEDVLNIAQVCVRWKTITSLRSFWTLIFARYNITMDQIPDRVKDNPNAWIVYYSACKNNLLQKNYVKNHSGQEGFANWRLSPDEGEGLPFRIEGRPVGCGDLPEDPEFPTTSCFVTSYTFANKYQDIDLWDAGLTPAVMKICAPFELSYSEMVASRFDCGGTGNVSIHAKSENICLMSNNQSGVEFLSQHPNLADDLNKREEFTIPPGSDWRTLRTGIVVGKEILEMCNVRYALLIQRGKDTQFWAGYYGPKFARSCVKFKFLDSEDTSPGPEAPQEKKSKCD